MGNEEMREHSPLCIQIMFACYVAADPKEYFSGQGWNSQPGHEARQWLNENGLINEDLTATDRGVAWVKFICSTPLPQQTWVLPERNGK